MNRPVIDLVYVEGCPNLDATRADLRAALGPSEAGGWREWDVRPPGRNRPWRWSVRTQDEPGRRWLTACRDLPH